MGTSPALSCVTQRPKPCRAKLSMLASMATRALRLEMVSPSHRYRLTRASVHRSCRASRSAIEAGCSRSRTVSISGPLRDKLTAGHESF